MAIEISLSSPLANLSRELKLPEVKAVAEFSQKMDISEFAKADTPLQRYVSAQADRANHAAFVGAHGISRSSFEANQGGRSEYEADQKAALAGELGNSRLEVARMLDKPKEPDILERALDMVGEADMKDVSVFKDSMLRAEGGRLSQRDSEVRNEMQGNYPQTTGGDLGVNVAGVARAVGIDVPRNVDVIASQQDGGAYVGIKFRG